MSSQWLNLAHQTACVTGAGSGIGKAIATALASQGCNLLLADVRHDGLSDVVSGCHANAPSHISVETSICDVTNKSQVQDVIAQADELSSKATNSVSPKASILINSAGITRDAKITNISEDDWDSVLDVNLKGTFFMCQAFCEPNRLKSLVTEGDRVGGSIINVGSIVSKYGNMGQANYAASKGGVVGLTRSLAKEMALFSLRATNNNNESNGSVDVGAQPAIIRVNCIQPGFICTPMAHAVPDGILNQMKQRIALKRLGSPVDVANLALFLASSERSGYITGEVLECSGMLRL